MLDLFSQFFDYLNHLEPHFSTLIYSFLTIAFILVGSLVLAWCASRIAGMLRLSVAEQRKVFWGFFFASPWILGFVIFVVGPSLASFYYSFTDYKLGEAINFIGLDNYRELLLGEGAHGGRFTQAMYNSFYYAIVGVPLQILTALVMALLLNQAMKGISVFRLIFYLPVILAGGPAILLAWRYMLASNGGFINTSIQNLGNSFFLLDWLKRSFIFLVEGVNSFYAGVAKGDPIGPLKFAIPAFLGFWLLYSLRGDWNEKTQGRASLVAEIIGTLLAIILFARAIIAQPIDPHMLLAISMIASVIIIVNIRQKKWSAVRLWQIGSLIAFAIMTGILLLDPTTGIVALYMPYLAIAVVPIVLTFFITDRRPLDRIIFVYVGIMGLVLVLYLAGMDFTNGRANALVQLITFQSTFQPVDANVLKAYDETVLSTFWIYGTLVALMAITALYNNRNPRLQRTLILVGMVFFGILAVSATLDGIRYFRAYDEIAFALGKPNYHFALFNKTLANFPTSDRVPLWLSNELWSKPSLILITMWSSGAAMLIFLAALKGVPQSLYEAAEVDGASRWQRFTRITLPMISPAMFYNIVIGVIAAIQTFESIYIISTDSTRDSLASAAYFLYERTFRQLAIGDGAAVSWVLAVVIITLTVFQFRFSKWVHYE